MIILINKGSTNNPKLDRIPEYDERSRKFNIANTLLPEEQTIITKKWKLGQDKILDQGNEGACVGFANTYDLMAGPAMIRHLDNEYAKGFYYECRTKDEWPGEAYEGTSSLAGMKVQMDRGFIRGYNWAFKTNDALLALSYKGPVLIGIPWYAGMYEPDKDGFVWPTGRYEGGHEICLREVVAEDKYVGFPNSWGTVWGQSGWAKMTYDTLDRLLQEQGDAAIPYGRKKVDIT